MNQRGARIRVFTCVFYVWILDDFKITWKFGAAAVCHWGFRRPCPFQHFQRPKGQPTITTTDAWKRLKLYEIQSDPKLIQSVWMACWCMWVPSGFRDCPKLLEAGAGKNQFPFRPMVKMWCKQRGCKQHWSVWMVAGPLHMPACVRDPSLVDIVGNLWLDEEGGEGSGMFMQKSQNKIKANHTRLRL